MSLSPEAIATLKKITTATITTILLKKGLRNVWLRGSRPLRPGQERLVGPAFTLRFVPAREDLATPESWSKPISTRTAIEAMPPGCIAVVDAMGITDAGIFGDILCARMAKRGVTALVTDGVVRDVEGVLGTGLPVWCDGAAAPPFTQTRGVSERRVVVARGGHRRIWLSARQQSRCHKLENLSRGAGRDRTRRRVRRCGSRGVPRGTVLRRHA